LAGASHFTARADHGDPVAIVVIVADTKTTQRLIRGNTLVSGDTVARTELEFVEEIKLLHEILLVRLPTQGAGRKKCPFIIGAEFRGTIAPRRECYEITVSESVVDPKDTRHKFSFGKTVADSIQLGITGI